LRAKFQRVRTAWSVAGMEHRRLHAKRVKTLEQIRSREPQAAQSAQSAPESIEQGSKPGRAKPGS
jgi:hypothetical protein